VDLVDERDRINLPAGAVIDPFLEKQGEFFGAADRIGGQDERFLDGGDGCSHKISSYPKRFCFPLEWIIF
jgi:hypothetical protein